MRALRSWSAFQGTGSRQAWLFAIARSTQVDWFRREHRQRRAFEEHTGDQGQAAAMDPNGDDAEVLWQAVEQLSREQREVVHLKFAGGLSYMEIAETLGVPIGTVRSRLFRALQALRSDRGVTNGTSDYRTTCDGRRIGRVERGRGGFAERLPHRACRGTRPWAKSMTAACAQTRDAIDIKTTRNDMPAMPTRRWASIRWAPAARWAAVVMISLMIGVGIGRRPSPTTPSVNVAIDTPRNTGARNWQDMVRRGNGFWGSKAAALLQSSPRRAAAPQPNLWETLRQLQKGHNYEQSRQ